MNVLQTTYFTCISSSCARVGCCPRTDPCRRLRSQVRTRLCVQVCFDPPGTLYLILSHLFHSQTFLNYLDRKNKECKYAGYLNKYLKYPPTGLLPLPGKSTEADAGCDLWTEIYDAALLINPAFNVYRIFDTVSASLSWTAQCR